MVDIINRIHSKKFIDFIDLFNANEGRIGIAVTFLAILELLKDAAIEVVQNEEFAPMHVRVSSSVHSLDG
jgi:segregation and condensation protein A